MKHPISNRALAVMVSILFVAVSLCGLICVSALGKTNKRMVVDSNNKFAFDLYSKLKDTKSNIFLSPLSVSTALAMTYAGAGGNTAKQMSAALNFTATADIIHPAFSSLISDLNVDPNLSGYNLAIANALWGQSGYKFRKEFIQVTDEYYNAGFKEVDFNEEEPARDKINTWVQEITHDKIKDLIPKGILTPLTRLVLTNAIYFKGDWESQFEKALTKEAPFSLDGGKKVDVSMMNNSLDLKYRENDLLQIVELPYAGENLSMLIILPKRSNRIKDVESILTSDSVEAWIGSLSVKKINLSIPRFKMESEFFLSKALKSLGMKDAFEAKLADFTGITLVDKEFFIDEVIHKSFIDVNEEGTEAAAATGVVMKTLAIREDPVAFRANHPFIFIIRDMVSGSILFIGRVTDPR